ncbi:MAG: AAA family ATPase, partial [Methanosarcinaceae archaeon]
DKAIDLVDEAAAMVRTAIDSKPSELDEADRKLMQLEIEREALKKEKDAASKERLENLTKELADIRSESDAVRARWESEKNIIANLGSLKEQIEDAKIRLELAENEGDFELASKLKYGTLIPMQHQYEEEENNLKEKQTSMLLKEEVAEDDIAEVVSEWTSIPVNKLMEGEREKLVHLEDELHQRLIGQNEAVTAVSDAVIRAYAGIKDPKRPIGSFIFLGPTGVGKTELAKALAAELFDDENNMIRIDMSEYMEKHTVSRLIGAPPGYVGHEEGGQLTEAVRRRPYSVVLFDEIEKAHHDVLNILLQLLDDGRLTDSHGRTVNFKNTLVIMTSNICVDYAVSKLEEGEDYSKMQEVSLNELSKHFRPEFLNRIDEVAIFHQLTREQLVDIVDIKVKDLVHRLKEKRIKMDLTSKAKHYLAVAGYSETYGARPLKRVIQNEVETEIGKLIVSGDIIEGDSVVVDANERGIVVNTSKKEMGESQ